MRIKLREMAQELYESIYSAEPCAAFEDTDFEFSALSTRDRQGLNRTISSADIKLALFHMRGLKMLGQDSLPFSLFQNNWDIVGQSVIDFVKNGLDKGEFPDYIKESLITLISKQEGPYWMIHFRPITLCNVIVKVSCPRPRLARIRDGHAMPTRTQGSKLLKG